MKLDLYLTTNNISDDAFGQKIGLSQSQVNRIRNGKSKPTLAMVAKISIETNEEVSFADFLGEPADKEGVT